MKHNNIFGDFIKRTAVLLSVMFVIATTAWAETITLTSGTGEVTLQDGDVLTGTGGADTHVMIARGATVTLSDVDITSITDNSRHQWAGITCLGDATITLADGTTNNLKGGFCTYPGIYVPERKTLTIQGSGTLNANGKRSCGIGGGKKINCGNIVIKGGTITATGGVYYAGIGGGSHASCGDITITGGAITATSGDDATGIGSGNVSICGNITITGGDITAIGGYHAAGIGSGRDSSCGNITITGGTISAMGGDSSAGIGGGYADNHENICGDITITRTVTSVTVKKGAGAKNSIGRGSTSIYCFCGTVTIGGIEGAITERSYTYVPSGSLDITVKFNANGGAGSMDDWQFTYDGTEHAIPACEFTAPDGCFFDRWNTEADGSGMTYTSGQLVHDIACETLYAQWRPFNDEITSSTGDLTLYNGQTLTGTGGEDTHLTIADGATVTLSSINVISIKTTVSHQWAGITCEGDATIILSGENALKGGHHSAGITVPEGHTLTIRGDGSLTTTGHMHAAGIGGNSEIPCGNIVIEGGTITATGGQSAAGIGGGYQGTCGNIVITGGTIAATGGKYATGIGCGREGSCGNITIARAVTKVTATKGESAKHSIGEGLNNCSCGTLIIGGTETDLITDSPYTYAPNGSLNNTIHFDKNKDDATGSMDDWQFTCDGAAHTLPLCKFTAPTGYFLIGWNTVADGSGTHYDDGQQIYDIACETLYAQWRPVFEEITTETGALKMYDGQTLTGTGGTETHITIADGATVTLSDVNITAIPNNASHQWAGITCLGDATIILEEGTTNAVTGGYHSAGVFVPEGHTLTIMGGGTLTAEGGSDGAGIGGNYETNCGNIIIEEGTITATGGSDGAGIGSGCKSACGKINIIGGIITAEGKNYGAGIGSGRGSDLTPSSCGDITIDGGTITAMSGRKYESGSMYAIGNGYYGTCGTVTIHRRLMDQTTLNSHNQQVRTIGPGITFAKEGYCTYYNSKYDATLPTDVKAYIVTAKSNDQTLAYQVIADGNTTHTIVPQGTAVMLQTAASDAPQIIGLALTSPSAAAISETNLLHGGDYEGWTFGGGTGAKYYKLSYNQNGENLGWYWGAEDGATFRSAAHKAWLALPPTAAAREFFGLPENYDSADGIENVNVNDNVNENVNDNAIYNLSGQKLSKPQKGINIINGRKVLF